MYPVFNNFRIIKFMGITILAISLICCQFGNTALAGYTPPSGGEPPKGGSTTTGMSFPLRN